MATFRHLEYLLWQGIQTLCDHHNLAYMYNHDECRGVVSKAASQRLENWWTCLGQYEFIMRIPEEQLG